MRKLLKRALILAQQPNNLSNPNNSSGRLINDNDEKEQNDVKVTKSNQKPTIVISASSVSSSSSGFPHPPGHSESITDETASRASQGGVAAQVATQAVGEQKEDQSNRGGLPHELMLRAYALIKDLRPKANGLLPTLHSGIYASISIYLFP